MTTERLVKRLRSWSDEVSLPRPIAPSLHDSFYASRTKSLHGQFGQATTEMVLVLPALVAFGAVAMVIVYTCWQGIKVQQAANLAARVQSQEKVGGGTSITEIQNENGTSDSSSNCDPMSVVGSYTGSPCVAPTNSVYDKFSQLVKAMFPSNAQNDLYVQPPQEGQNFDKIKIVRVINLPKLPFWSWGSDSHPQIKLEGDAWGGEDTYMYGLPRWGKTSTSGNDPEWKRMMTQSANGGNNFGESSPNH